MCYLSISRCTSFITSSAECVNTCEQGFQIAVIPNTTLSARVCEGKHCFQLKGIKLYGFALADAATQTKSQLPGWAIIVIAVMSGFVILTAIIVLLVISFSWFNRVR